MVPARRHEIARTVAAIAFVAGCARTTVQPRFEAPAAAVPRPDNVYVFDFAVSSAEVAEDQNLFSGAVAAARGTTAAHRRRDIAEQVVDRLADDMVDGIRKLGLPAKRLTRGGPLPPGSVVVSGRFPNVNEGNQLRRVVIGFAGKSSLETQVQLHGMSGGRYQLLQEFTTHADSGVKAYRSSVEQAAARTANQAVAQLSIAALPVMVVLFGGMRPPSLVLFATREVIAVLAGTLVAALIPAARRRQSFVYGLLLPVAVGLVSLLARGPAAMELPR